MQIINRTENKQLQIQGKLWKNMKKLKYFGTITKTDSRIKKERGNRIRKVISIYSALYGSFFNKKYISKKTKTKFIYGSKSWIITNNLKQKITTCEMKILRCKTLFLKKILLWVAKKLKEWQDYTKQIVKFIKC